MPGGKDLQLPQSALVSPPHRRHIPARSPWYQWDPGDDSERIQGQLKKEGQLTEQVSSKKWTNGATVP